MPGYLFHGKLKRYPQSLFLNEALPSENILSFSVIRLSISECLAPFGNKLVPARCRILKVMIFEEDELAQQAKLSPWRVVIPAMSTVSNSA